MALQRFSQSEFLNNRWDYGAGEHLTMLAPTQNGKTTFTFELLKHVPKLKNKPVMLIMKPRDPTVSRGIKDLNYRVVRNWPPLPSILKRDKQGYALWPIHTFDPEIDDERLYSEMKRALLDSYKKGNIIVIADETYGISKELKLERQLTAIHSRGAGMGVGLWCMTQKPTHIGLWAYSQAEHLFLGFDPDKKARERFDQIGGVDPHLVETEVLKLKKYEWLYIRRTGPLMCVIEAK